jgi:hypothetical protein
MDNIGAEVKKTALAPSSMTRGVERPQPIIPKIASFFKFYRRSILFAIGLIYCQVFCCYLIETRGCMHAIKTIRRTWRFTPEMLAFLRNIAGVRHKAPILNDIFSFFDQAILTRGILTGHRAVTARTGDAGNIHDGE